jgi:uncharacterized membrane protein YkvA (DUF1232 family)
MEYFKMSNKPEKTLTERSLLNKGKDLVGGLSKDLLVNALILYYALLGTLAIQYKAAVVGALCYFLLPFDSIPDFAPVIGYSDDAALIATVLASLKSYIDLEEYKKEAESKVD